MKQLYLFFLAILLAGTTIAQPVFNWTSTEIRAKKNLQKMTVSGNEAVVAGFGRSFVKSTDNGATWNDVGILTLEFDFIDMSWSGNSGYLVSNRNKLTDGFPDSYSPGIVLHSPDAGATWKNVELTGLGSGDNPALSPMALPNFGLDFQSVGCANDSVAILFLRWMEYNPEANSGYNTHSGIFKTSDRGATWKNLSGDLTNTVISTIVFDDTTCYIGGNKVLFKTGVISDSLISIFANLNTSGNGYINDIHVAGSKELYLITVAHGIFKSTDGGDTFEKFSITGITGGNDIYKVDDKTLFVGGGSGKSRFSNDAGATWTDAGLTTSIWEVGGVFNDSLVLLAKSDIYKISLANLKAGTMTWVPKTLSPDNNIHKMKVFDADNALLIGLGQTFLRTFDKGINWKELPLPEVPLPDDNLDFNGLRNIGDTAVACMNRFYLADYPSTVAKNDIYFQGAIFRTTDNWATWTNLDAALIGKDEGNDPSRNPQLPVCNGLNTSAIEYVGNGVILLWARWYDYSATERREHNRVFRSTDNGKKWSVVTDDFGGVFVQDIRFRGETGYIAGNKILQKSTDGGATFTDIYPAFKAAVGDDHFINTVTFGPGDEIFITSTSALIRSADGGTTFAKVSGNSGGNDFWRFDSDSWLVMGTTTKSQYTNDAGTSWTSASTGASIFEIGGVWNEYVYALGQGKIYRTPLEGLNTAARMILSEDGLAVAYGPSAVEFFSPEKPIEHLRVWTVTGKLVRDTKPASNRATLNYGSFVPGVYIARTLAGGKVFVNKIVIP